MTRISGSLACASLLLVSSIASAQPAVTPAPAAPAPEPTPAPAPAPDPAPVADPTLTPPPETLPPPEPKPFEEAPLPEAAVEQTEEAAAESPAPKVTGYVEAAYHLLASSPDGQGSTPVSLRSYDAGARNSFLLHAAHLAVGHSFNDEVSAVIEFDAGTDATVNSFMYGSGLFDVQEAYATYKPSEFSLTLGKFVTYAGIEVIEGPMNPTLTRGFLFGLAEAFTHVGAKAHYTTDTFDVGIGFINGWDQLVDINGAKMLMFKIGLTPSDMFFIAGSGYITIGSDEGDADRGLNSFDITGSINASESFALWFQGNFGMQKAPVGDGDASWFGLGLQPVYTADAFSFGGRVEWFSDPDGARTGLGASKASVLNLTLTPGYTFAEAFTMRFEYRMDIVLSGEVGGTTDTEDLLATTEDPDSMQHSIGLSASYVFN